jgi:hypothetical protein
MKIAKIKEREKENGGESKLAKRDAVLILLFKPTCRQLFDWKRAERCEYSRVWQQVQKNNITRIIKNFIIIIYHLKIKNWC